MSTQKNLITLCFAAVFTLGLAACGGGGGGAPVTGMPPMEPEALACDADAGSSQACVDARQAELEAIENDSDATVGALNAAEMALATAQTALADANTAAEETMVSGLVDDAMTATADITDESTPAEVDVGRAAIDAAQESLEGMENLSADVTAALQGRIDTLESSFSPNEMAVRIAAQAATDAQAEADRRAAATPAEQLTAAQNAVADAQALVDSASTPTEIAAAYSALAAAQSQLSAAESIPANQIAILAARLQQLGMDLRDTQMLAAQRGTVGAALIAAQTAVSGLSATSTDEEAAAANAAVTAAQTALAKASALPADDALHTSVMAVATQLAGVEMSRTVYSQQGAVDAALIGAQAAVDALSNASTDAEVEAARVAVMAAQAELALATDLVGGRPPACVGHGCVRQSRRCRDDADRTHGDPGDSRLDHRGADGGRRSGPSYLVRNGSRRRARCGDGRDRGHCSVNGVDGGAEGRPERRYLGCQI